MKKITFIFLMLLGIAFSWQTEAQFVDESFEGTFAPAGWTIFNNGTGNDWELNTSATFSNTGTNSAKYTYHSSNAADAWMFTGTVTLGAGESVDWSFYTRSRGFTEKLKFTVGTGATVADQTTTLVDIADVANTYGEQKGTFTAVTAGDYYFAFNCYSTANQFEVFVDDVLIVTPPSCVVPTDLATANITDTNVDLAWTDNASASTWEYVVQAAGTGMPTVAGTSVTSVTETVSGLTAETDYEVYVRADCGAGDFSEWLGPVNFTTLVSCLPPTNLTTSNITVTGVDLAWTDNASASAWEYVVQAAGTGTPTAAGTSVAVVTETVSGLTSATDYELYVRTDCGNGDLSTWEGPVNFTTNCDVYMPDYTEDFTTFVPTCWEEATSGNPTTGPTGFGSGAWMAEEFAHGSSSGLGAVNINLYTDSRSDWVLSPYFNLSAGGYELKLDVALTNFNSTAADTMGDDDEVQLLYTEDGTTWNNLMTWNAGNQPATAGETITVVLTSTGTNVRFGIWATDGAVDDTNDYDFHIDNFVVRTIPSCLEPSDLATSNVATTGVDLAWTDNASASAWEYVVQPAGTGEPTVTGDSAAAVTQTVTGLMPETDYEVYVRADCGGGDFSLWVGPVNFTTLISCEVPTDLSISNVTYTSGDLAWTDNASASAWEYVVQAAGTGEPAAGMAGTASAAVTAAVTGLSANTAYEVYVRADCGGGDFSKWTGPVDFYTGYCQPEVTSSGLTYVDTFNTTNGITNITNASTGFSTDNYGNYFDTASVSLAATRSFDFSVEIVGGTAGCAIWVDWNNDLIFDVATENVFENGDYGDGPFTGTITVPAGTADGDYRMRIMIDYSDSIINDDACTFNGTRGEVEDYKVTVDATLLPACVEPSDIVMSNQTDTGVDMAWTDNASASAWEYVVQAAGTGEPMVAGTQVTAVTETVTGLTPDTSYEVYVRADCGAGSFSAWAGPVEFYTGPCLPEVTSSGLTYVDTFNTTSGITNIANASTGFSTGNYGNYYGSMSVSLAATRSFDFSAEIVGGTAGCAVWVDWNNDFVFDVATETVFENGGYGGGPFTGTITVPAGTPDGDYRMRIMIDYSDSVINDDACTFNGTRGEVEDYKIIVDAALIPSCLEPTDLATSNVIATGVDLAWTDNASASAWEYVIQPVGTGEPMAAGTSAAAVTETVTGLTSDTAYEVYVRTDCGGGDFSLWTGPVNFTTPISCEVPTDLVTSNITTTGVDLAWTDNASASAWEYVVQAAGTGEPMAAGTAAGATTATVTGLTVETAYEVYVRADCGNGDYSRWAGPVEFFTGHCQPEITTGTATYIDTFNTTNGATNIANAGTGFSTDNYGNYFDTMSVSLAPEQSFDFSAEIVGGTVGCAVWVDWNNDLVFDIATETVFENGGYGDGPFTGTITVPAGTVNGDYRMRIMIDYLDGVINDDACTFGGTRGEVEDYKIIVDNVLSTANATIDNFVMYPNPVTNVLNLKAQNNINAVSIYNMLGQEVLKTSANDTRVQINMSNLPSGAYIIKVKASEQVGTYQLIKK